MELREISLKSIFFNLLMKLILKPLALLRERNLPLLIVISHVPLGATGSEQNNYRPLVYFRLLDDIFIIWTHGLM